MQMDRGTPSLFLAIQSSNSYSSQCNCYNGCECVEKSDNDTCCIPCKMKNFALQWCLLKQLVSRGNHSIAERAVKTVKMP